MNKHFALVLTLPLLPVLLVQGYWARKRTPRLPDAAGPLEGTVAGGGEPIQLIAIGESTVAGIGASTHETALTGQVARALSEHSKRTVNWLVVARSGINARRSLVELVPKLAGRRADVVLIALGVNDSLEFHSARRWAADIARLIAGIRAEVGDALVLLAGVPPLDYFPALPQPLAAWFRIGCEIEFARGNLGRHRPKNERSCARALSDRKRRVASIILRGRLSSQRARLQSLGRTIGRSVREVPEADLTAADFRGFYESEKEAAFAARSLS